MSKFAQLQNASIDAGTTREYPFGAIPGEPTLIVRPATQLNRDYTNALLRMTGNARMKRKKLNASLLDSARDDDRKLYARFVVTGWKNVVDGQGNEVAFNKDECLDFLTQLPDFLMDELREYCATIDNFFDDDYGIDEELVKNS